jgi:Protein of unknown function DUF262
MTDDKPLFEMDVNSTEPDPDEIPIKDRKVITQPYDLIVESLIDQIKNGTIFLRPLSERPNFQRRYVWTDVLASRLVESILLNVPIPPCYLSQNEDFELDVIDGQQRLFSIYRFFDNRFKLSGLEVLKDINGLYFHEIPQKLQRQLKTHTLRCILITNESHPEIKFDVFERLNTNTAPLNSQELRNCIYRGSLNDLLKDSAEYKPWLNILGKKQPDKRMRDEELILRFFAFNIHGLDSYKTPQKHWLNDAAKAGKKYPPEKISELDAIWKNAIDISLKWFEAHECFRRLPSDKSRTINRALFDLIMHTASQADKKSADQYRERIRQQFINLITEHAEFQDLISRAVDHTKRTRRRFEIWNNVIGVIFQ